MKKASHLNQPELYRVLINLFFRMKRFIQIESCCSCSKLPKSSRKVKTKSLASQENVDQTQKSRKRSQESIRERQESVSESLEYVDESHENVKENHENIKEIQKQVNVDDRAIEILSDEDYGSKENANKLYLRDKENSETEKKYNRKDNTKKKSKSKHVIMVTKTEGAVIKQKTLNNKNQENTEPEERRMMTERGTGKHGDGSEEGDVEEGDIERGVSSTMRYFEIS